MNRRLCLSAAVLIAVMAGACGGGKSDNAAASTKADETTTTNPFLEAARTNYPLLVGPWERGLTACQSLDVNGDRIVAQLTSTMEATNAAAQSFDDHSIAIGAAIVAARIASRAEVVTHFTTARTALLNCWKDHDVVTVGAELDWVKSKAAALGL